MGKVHFQQKFEDLLSEMHHLVEAYAEERNLLRLQNTVLQNEIKHLQQQFELLQKLLPEHYKHHLEKITTQMPPDSHEEIIIPKKIIAWLDEYIYALETGNTALCEALLHQVPKQLQTIKQMKQQKFEQLVEQIEDILRQSNELPTRLTAFMLNIFLACEGEQVERMCHIQSHSKLLQPNVLLLPLQLQVLVKYEQPQQARQYLETMLAEQADSIYETLETKAFIQLFWLSFLLNAEDTFLSYYREIPVLKSDSRTALYFKYHHKKTTDDLLETYKNHVLHAKLLPTPQMMHIFEKIDALRTQYC